jgi:hypothetical protein
MNNNAGNKYRVIEMIRWHWHAPVYGGGAMPDFTTVSVQEAQMRTILGRQGKFINEYADYIQQVPQGQAGKLRIGEEEKHPTVRRRLVSAANALNIPLTIKRSGNDLYFWREDTGEEQAKSKRSYTRRIRRGTPGSLIPSDMLIGELEVSDQGIVEEETTPLDQSFTGIE